MRPTILSFFVASLLAGSFGTTAMADVDNDRGPSPADRQATTDVLAAKDQAAAVREQNKAIADYRSQVLSKIDQFTKNTNAQLLEKDRNSAANAVSASAAAGIMKGAVNSKIQLPAPALGENSLLQATAHSGSADRLDREKGRNEKAFRCVEGGFFVDGKSCDPISKFSSTHPELAAAKVTLNKKTVSFSKLSCAATVTKVKGRKIKSKRAGSLSNTALCNPVEYGLQASGAPFCVSRFSRKISANCQSAAFNSAKKETSLAWAMAIRQQFPKLKKEQEARRTQICAEKQVTANAGWEINSNMNNVSDIEKTCESLTSSGRMIASAEERAGTTQVASAASAPQPPASSVTVEASK